MKQSLGDEFLVSCAKLGHAEVTCALDAKDSTRCGRLRCAEVQVVANPGNEQARPARIRAGTDSEQVSALTNVTGGAIYASYTYDAAGNQLTRS